VPNYDEDDTDPQPSRSGSFRLKPQAPSTPEEGALSESARGAWGLALLVGAILGGALVAGAAVAQISAYEAGKAVAPIERKVDDHLSAMASERRMMDLYVSQQAKSIESINRKLDALCRASARPAVCLGEP
jgi:hypothetical protein